MKRLKLLIIIFILTLSVPLTYFVWRTYKGLEQEEFSELRFFAETLFNEMEQELATLVRREERRAIDEYNRTYVVSGGESGDGKQKTSPLTAMPDAPYILGYFQNNPDGSFQTPLTPAGGGGPPKVQTLIKNLETLNEAFNSKRTAAVAAPVAPEPASVYAPQETVQSQSFAEKYLNLNVSSRKKSHLGTERKRIEAITRDQAVNLARKDETPDLREPIDGGAKSKTLGSTGSPDIQPGAPAWEGSALESERDSGEAQPTMGDTSRRSDSRKRRANRLEAEVDPMQSLFLNNQYIFVFRRIAVKNRIYRQGFVLKINDFLDYLVNQYFSRQPMARFARIDLSVVNQAHRVASKEAGAVAQKPAFQLDRRFPRPFSFLEASLTCETIPRSQGRKTLGVMMAGLGIIMLAGLFAIYRSARTIMDLSERRSRFASSVTHELKTPLTNIRMYIEMLEQGIARSPEREQEYYKILNSESGRLSRLINNVLEFSKLEQKKLHLERVTGTFEEVIEELVSVMQMKLKQDGFSLTVIHENVPLFVYDREVMLQVLINLLENSMKFGEKSLVREITLRVEPDGKWAKISVSDRGPGIPRHALKRVFDDFYRVDDSHIQTTRGTGIGLAFVKKAVKALGGKVWAEKNGPSGCKIIICLPLEV